MSRGKKGKTKQAAKSDKQKHKYHGHKRGKPIFPKKS
jgi:hypothetical protein